MKINIEDIGKNNKRLVVRGSGYAIANIIKGELLKLDSIEFAGVEKPHPQKDKISIVIRGGNIEENIKKAIENGKERFKEIKSEVNEKWAE